MQRGVLGSDITKAMKEYEVDPVFVAEMVNGKLCLSLADETAFEDLGVDLWDNGVPLEEPVEADNNQKSNIEHLLALIKENPDLEIMPLVDAEIVASDDWGWWVADWGGARVDHFWSDDDRAYSYSEDFDRMVEDKCDLVYDHPEYAGLSDEEFKKKVEETIEAYAWQKVIFVRIITP